MTAWTLACIAIIVACASLLVSLLAVFRPYLIAGRLETLLKTYIAETRRTDELVREQARRIE